MKVCSYRKTCTKCSAESVKEDMNVTKLADLSFGF